MPPSAPTVGSQRLHCRVLGRLGGGMGEVYLAEDTRLGRQVALKFLTTTDDGGPEARERLVRIAMEDVAGALRSTRSGRGTVDVAEALEIARQVEFAAQAQEGFERRLTAARYDGNGVLAHPARPLEELSAFTRRRLPRDPDCADVLADPRLAAAVTAAAA
jgi:hypothetical protein